MRLAFLALAAFASAPAPAQVTFSVDGHENRPIDERLYQAVSGGNVAAVRTLLAKGANARVSLGYADSMLATLGGNSAQQLAIAKLLVAKGARVDGNPGDHNFTPLTHVFYGPNENLALLRYLLLKGANPNKALEDGKTPLHGAVERGFLASARALLAAGARVDLRTKEPHALHAGDSGLVPAERRDLDQRQGQLDHLFEPGFRMSGETPIFGLAVRWNPAMADLLLKAGASLKATDDNGWTPLHHAAHDGAVEAAVGMIVRGADPNAASKGGYRPLHLALRVGFGVPDAAMVTALIAHGADPHLRNKAGQTPLDLLRAGAEWRVGNPSNDPQTAFPKSALANYQATVDAAAKALNPAAPRIVLALPKPDPKGQHYAPLELGDGLAERTVRVENGEAILELRLPSLAKGEATLTVQELSLEEYDTLTPLPLVVHRKAGVPDVLTFRFPKGAASGGDVVFDYEQRGPGDQSSGAGGGGPNGTHDLEHPGPGFLLLGGVSVTHDLADRTMEFEIVSAKRAGKTLPGFAGKRLLVTSGKPVPIPGLQAVTDPASKAPKTNLLYRYRYLPNVRWRAGSMEL